MAKLPNLIRSSSDDETYGKPKKNDENNNFPSVAMIQSTLSSSNQHIIYRYTWKIIVQYKRTVIIHNNGNVKYKHYEQFR